mgnify:CR=1 FL=1|tara:strand:+ start:1172 stop:1528 length:357 start_codon:yes stop_codon:yes gene_type:complete
MASERGTRLPDDWELPEDFKRAATKLGLDEATIEWEEAKFIDYWTAVCGARAVKRNWLGTWRNWCRRSIEQQGSSLRPKPRQVWQLSDDELLKMAAERSIATRGLSRSQLVAAVEAKH